jgi:hypothetical protein
MTFDGLSSGCNEYSICKYLYLLIPFIVCCILLYVCIQIFNRFMFLTEIKNVGKPDVEIDVKYSERDRTVRYGLLAISALSYTENQGGATGVTENQGGATGATREPGGCNGCK